MDNGLQTTKLSELPEAITLNESDYSLIVQNGTSKKIKGLLLKGNTGDNGKSIEIQKTDTHIQWRQERGQWINLVALADLKGDKGEQGEGANVDLTDYATKVWVTQQLASYYTKAEIDLSLSNKADISHAHTEYASIDHVHNYNDLTNKPTIPSKTSDLTNDSSFLTSIPSEYVTEEEMNTALSNKANKSDIPSLDGYATENFVTTKIAEAALNGGEVDLSGYATKTYTDNAISTALDGHTFKFLTQAEYDALETKDPLVEYHITDITDTGEGITTEQAQQLQIAYEHSQSVHVQASDIPTKTSDLQNDSEFITSIPEEYITETELSAKGYLTSHQDISGLQTKTDNSLTTTSKEIVGAINSINEQLDTKANNSTVDNVISRIDNLIINSGEGSGKDSELVDMRVDSEGHTYDLAGQVVREVDRKVNEIITTFQSDRLNVTLPLVKKCAGISGWVYNLIPLTDKKWADYKYVFVALEISFSGLTSSVRTSVVNVVAKGLENEIVTEASDLLTTPTNIVNGETYILQYRMIISDDKLNQYPNAANLFIQYGNSSFLGDAVVTVSNIFIKGSDLRDVSDIKNQFDIYQFTPSYSKKVDYRDINPINKPRIDGQLLTKDTSMSDFKPQINEIINDRFQVESKLLFSNKAKNYDISSITCASNGGTVQKTINEDGSVSFSSTAINDSAWVYTKNITIPNFTWIPGNKYLIGMRVVLDEITDRDDNSSSAGNYAFDMLGPTPNPYNTGDIGSRVWKNNIGTIKADTDLISICVVDETKLSNAQFKNALVFQVGRITNNTSLSWTIKGLCIMDLTELGLEESKGVDTFNKYLYSNEDVYDNAYNITVKKSQLAQRSRIAEQVESINISTGIEIWGDSLVAQGYGRYISEILDRDVLTKGYGGKQSTYIRDKFLSEFNPTKTQIINVGRNNYREVDIVLQDIRMMVDAIPHDNFLICCPPNGNYGEGVGTSSYDCFTKLEQKLQRRYQSNFLNTREATIEEYHMGNVKLVNSFTQPQVGSSVTVKVSDAKFLTTFNSNDEGKWGAEFMNKIVIGRTIDEVDVYSINSYDLNANTLNITLLENNSPYKPGNTIQNGVDDGGLNSVKYCRVLQYADYYCYMNDITQSTFRSDGIHMSTEGQKCIAKVVARKINTMKI